MTTIASPADEQVLLNRREAAAFLRVKPQTLAAWASRGLHELPFVKVGRKIVRYRRADLEAFLRRQTITSTAESAHA